MNPPLTWTFWQGLWTLFVLSASAGMLMLAYWYLEKRLLPWWHAFFSIVGLFFVRLILGPIVFYIPFNFLWWWLFTAVYFRLTLPGALPVWEAGVLSFLQQLYTYLFALTVAFLGFVTAAHPSAYPASPNVPQRAPRLSSPRVSALNPTAPVANPASVVVRPVPVLQPPPERPAVTLSGMARTMGTNGPRVPLPNPPPEYQPPAPTLPNRPPPPLPAVTLPVPAPTPVNTPVNSLQ